MLDEPSVSDGSQRPTTQPLRTPEALSPALRLRRALTLLVITLVVPGSAQVVAGDRRVGRVAVRAWLVVVASTLVLLATFVVDRTLILSILTRPWVLSLLAGAFFAAAVAMPVLLLDAFRLGRPSLLPVRATAGVAAVTAVLVLVTSLPLVMAGRRAWAAGDLISGVFGSGKTSAAVDGRYNVLLLGGDAGADRIGLRPDSITLASIDEHTGRTVLFSLPRNLQNIPFPKGSVAGKALPHGWSCGDVCLLNALYTWGTEHKSLYRGVGNPGAAAMEEAVEGVTGLKVNYYVLVDLQGFRSLIDAMGGITLRVGSRVPIGGGTSRITGYIKPGRQHMDGYHALWYARSRQGSSDYERMARQRCVMTAMVNQLDPATLLARFQRIAAAGKQVVHTDLPASQLATFIDLGTKAKAAKITSVQFVPPLTTPARPDFVAIRRSVQVALATARSTANAAGTAGPGGKPSAAKPSASRSGSTSKPGASAAAGSAAKGAEVDVRTVCSAG